MGKSWKWLNSLRTLLLVLVAGGLWSCGNECDDPADVSGLKQEVRFEQVEQELKDLSTVEASIEFMDRHPAFSELILGRSQAINDTLLAKAQLIRMGQSPFVDTICADVERIFGDFSDERLDFQTAFAHIRYYYPEFKDPRVLTLITGFEDFQVYDADSILFLGIEFFLGAKSTYRPDPIQTPHHILRQFYPESLVPKSLLIFSQRFQTFDPKDNTLLANMIYFGKSYYFAKRMLPCVPDSTLLGYSSEELTRLSENAATIYGHYASQELFYSTDATNERKYVAERPSTPEIGELCPGRTGRWLGYQIVCAYMARNPKVTLQELMAEPSATLIFQEAHYKPAQ